MDETSSSDERPECEKCRVSQHIFDLTYLNGKKLCAKCFREYTQEEIKSINAAKNDPVNKPSHYTDSKIEVLDAIEAWKMPYHLGQVIKYVARAGKKDKSKEIEDLEKAQFYLARHIKNLKGLNVVSKV